MPRTAAQALRLLPSVTCVAGVMCDALPHDAEGIASVRGVISCRRDQPFPVEPHVISQFAVMDWMRHAVA